MKLSMSINVPSPDNQYDRIIPMVEYTLVGDETVENGIVKMQEAIDKVTIAAKNSIDRYREIDKPTLVNKVK